MRRARAALSVAAALSAAACADAFFHDPATTGVVPLAVSYSFEGAAAAAGPADAFDRADRAVVRVRLGEAVVLTETVTLEPGSADKRITIELDLPPGTSTGDISVELSAGTARIFTGTAPVSLRAGQAAEVTVPLVAVETALEIRNAPTTLRLGGTVQLSAVTLFATGDEVGPVTAAWTALSPAADVTPAGQVTGMAVGLAEVRASYLALTAEASFDVRDPCLELPTPLAIGNVVEGSLSRSEDCATAAPDVRLFDRFALDLGLQQAFTTTLSATPFHPSMPVSDPLGVQRSAFGSPGEASFTREFVLAPGTWTFDVTSVGAGTALQNAPEGSYGLTLVPLGAVQDGCGAATAVSYGVTVTGSVQSNDCEDALDVEPGVVRWSDALGMRMPLGETRTVQVVADFPYSLTHRIGGSLVQGVVNVPAGDPAAVTGIVAQTAFHEFFIASAGDHDSGSWTASFVRNGPLLAPNLIVNATSGVPAQLPEEGSFTLEAQVANAGGPMAALLPVRADVYVAAQPDLLGPHVLLGAMDYTVQLGNLATASRSQLFTIPPGVSGPHFILIDLDAGLAVSESSEQNLFVAGEVDVSGSPLAITTTLLRDAVVGALYSDTLEATGGTGPPTWTVVSGLLPDGLVLDASTGVISGTPTLLGISAFTVRATSPDGQTADRLLEISVVTATPLLITTLLLPDGALLAFYNQVLTATGGGGGYTWSVASGSLPTGLTLDPAFGTISGLASELGIFPFDIQVASADGQTAQSPFSISIVPGPLEIVSDSILPTATEAVPYSQTLVGSGGVPPYLWALDAGLLPAGLTLDPATGVISGTPTTAGLSLFTIRLEDSVLTSVLKQFRVTVSPP